MRKAMAALLVFAVTAGAGLAASPARAGVVDVLCPPLASTEGITYTPALTSASQSVSVALSRSYGGCTSLSEPSAQPR
jgi:hypothetical protein